MDPTELIWSLARTTPLKPSSALAPYPTLAAIGTDEEGATWLLDLESAGIVTITGNWQAARELAMFIAAELAVNEWSDSVDVGVGDFAASLVSLRPDRVAAVRADPIPDLVKTARRVSEACTRVQQDVLAGRMDGSGGDTWMPTVSILSEPTAVTPGALAPLEAELLGGGRRAVGLVLVGGVGESVGVGARLSVGEGGVLIVEPYGVRLKANRLSAADAADIADLFGHHDDADDEPVPAAPGERPYETVSDAAGAVLPEHTAVRTDGDPDQSLLPLPDRTYLSKAATTTEDLAALAPSILKQISEQILALDPTLDGDLAEWKCSETSRPRLRLLGPVELHVQAEMPKEVARRLAYDTELVAFLVTRPHGATPEQVADAFGCATNSIHTRMGEIRKWFGPNPATGEWYLPSRC